MDRLDSGDSFGRSWGRTFLISVLCFIGFGAAVAIVTSIAHYQLQQTTHLYQVQQQFRIEHDRIIERLRYRLRGLDDQLASLANNPITHRYLENKTTASTQALRNLYLATTGPNTLYRQLCYLDSQGQPQLCVNRGDDYSRSGNSASLQHNPLARQQLHSATDSSESDNQQATLFNSARLLAHGDVKHSLLQIAADGEMVRPSFQSATPVYVEGRLNGILVATLDVRHLLRELINSNNFVVQLVEGDKADPRGFNVTNPESRQRPSASITLTTPSGIPVADADQAYRLPLGELLQNDQSLYLILTPKRFLPPDLADDTQFNTLLIALLVTLVALPLAWFSTRIPDQLHRHLHRTLLKLRRSNRLLDQNVISSRTDTEGNFTHVSQAFCELSGYTRQELIGQPYSLVCNPDSSPKIYEEILRTLSSGRRWQGELCNRDKQGHDCWVSTSIAPDFDRHGTIIGYTQISRDITDHKLLQKLSTIDAQTQLLNRRHLDAMLEQQIGLFQRYPELLFSVVLIRLDSPVDAERLEREVILSRFGELLSSNVRTVDLLGRWDEQRFLIICPCTAIEKAAILANKLQQRSQNPPRHEIGFNISIGLVQSQIGDNRRLLIGRAAQALQLALEKPDKLVVLSSGGNGSDG
ncbi:sensor domain-containing diguanylate cyclase [Motiliproteus coralliicola]|nr:PAS domain S-box protein [Motiliproteus coralliicola]